MTRAEREHRYQAEQIVALNHRIEALLGEIAATKQRQALDRGRDRAAACRGAAGTRACRPDRSRHFARPKPIISRRLDIVADVEKEAESAHSELLQHTAAVERYAEMARQLAANLEKLGQRIEGLGREAERAESAFSDHQTEAQKSCHDASDRGSKACRVSGRKAGHRYSVGGSSRSATASAEGTLNAVKEEFSRKRNRLETLQELEEKRAVYAPPVQKFLPRKRRSA